MIIVLRFSHSQKTSSSQTCLNAHHSSSPNQEQNLNVQEPTTPQATLLLMAHRLSILWSIDEINVSHCVSYCSTHTGVGAWLLLSFAAPDSDSSTYHLAHTYCTWRLRTHPPATCFCHPWPQSPSNHDHRLPRAYSLSIQLHLFSIQLPLCRLQGLNCCEADSAQAASRYLSGRRLPLPLA